MKIRQSSYANLSGFSWVPIIFICVLVVAFCVVVIGVLMPCGRSQGGKQTMVTLQNTRLKLEEYRNEHNGIYPVGEDSSSSVLYRTLSGDESGLGKTPTGPVYWKELHKAKNPAFVGELNGRRVIVDGYGNSLRYRSALDKNQKPVSEVRNEENFDLWSTGPDGKPTDINTTGTIENEETEDDIWPN